MPRKKKLTIHKKHTPGTAPGTLSVPDGASAPQMYIIAYNGDDLVERPVAAVAEIPPLLEKWDVVWVNVNGLGSVDLLQQLGALFNLHMLALEDVLNLQHRPKTEDFGDHLFMVSRMATLHDKVLDVEQTSMFVGKKFVLTFQEKEGDCLDPVRHRLRHGQGKRIRMLHSDYLAYAINDAIIDGYFPVLEHYGDRLNNLEDIIIGNPRRDLISEIHDIRRDLRSLRHSVWPMREMINGFSADTDVVHEDTRPFLRDAYDHIIQVLDMLETYREMASGLLDIYLSSVSNKMNEVMKTLTIIATIFIPLGFVAGLYGMNFDTSSPWNMPELSWRYGYPALLAFMAVIAGGLLAFFRRRGWL